ncbi:hypothetical protein ACFOZ5_15700 [Marinobacter lacisalsi]|uniref:Uncharacterized protein n=1 Tax=Marinobacter lacisalsi TaxID=475979 RepID=A0ABV8QL23_9GAMM
MTADTPPDENGRARDRRFSVSSNRGAASHRLRYVEAGGASVDTEECSFCQSNPELDWQAESASPAGDTTNAGKRPKQD